MWFLNIYKSYHTLLEHYLAEQSFPSDVDIPCNIYIRELDDFTILGKSEYQGARWCWHGISVFTKMLFQTVPKRSKTEELLHWKNNKL